MKIRKKLTGTVFKNIKKVRKIRGNVNVK